MKKTMIVVLAFAMFVAAFGAVGSAYAMEDAGKGPGNGGNGANGNGAAGANGTSILSAYMDDAAASVLGLDTAEVAERLVAGETFYDIALSMGYTAETWQELFADAKAIALEAAAADGFVPQGQSQMNTNMGIQAQLHDGTCDGTCMSDPTLNLYSGSNAGMRGRRGGR